MTNQAHNQEAVGLVHRLIDPDTRIEVELIEFGGTVTRWLVPDHEGKLGDVLLGCPTLRDYAGPQPHFNCLVGRYANRMTDARFTLDGKTYVLDANIGPHHLHGGRQGFGRRRWASEAIDRGVRFSLESPDGEGGYPGNLEVRADYVLEGDTLQLTFRATTDAPTPVSLTSHPYFNLSAVQGTQIADHEIEVAAGAYLPVSDDLTQLGVIEPVDGTPFDLRRPTRIGDRLNVDEAQLRLAGGFDHTFAIDGYDGSSVVPAATVVEPTSRRRLRVATNQPGMQLYTTNSLDDPGKDGVTYGPHQGFCLETQQFPDAPNHDAYPEAILRPGETLHAITRFRFDTV